MHLNMSYSEVRNMPTAYRRWYIDRLVKYFKEINGKKDDDVTPMTENIRKIDDIISKL
jgi:hypothetical protein